jgi:hypothetical protein
LIAGDVDTSDKLLPVSLLLAINYVSVVVTGDESIATVMESMKIHNKAGNRLSTTPVIICC